MIARMLCLFPLLVFAPARAQIPLDSLHGPVCAMIDPQTHEQAAISPVFTRVNVVITDAVAQAVITQRFVNPFAAASEVAYMFPLPEQGAVHGMRYEYKQQLYTAEIMDRDKAQAKYDSVKNGGGQAALLLQERPNIFMQRIANMGPGDTAYIEIKLSMPLKYVDGELELAFPTRIGPRYHDAVAKIAGAKIAAAKTAAAQVYTPWNPPEDRAGPEFQFNVLIQSGVDLGSIYSPTHPIDVGELSTMKQALTDRQVLGGDFKNDYAYTRGVLLKTQATYPNRDFVLRLRRAQSASDFSVATYHDTKGGSFMLNLYPDTSLFAGARPDLEVILLVDISGSQSGWPLDREKEITLNILSRLTPRDNVDVMAFSDDIYYAYGSPTPVPATPANIATGENFVRGLAVQGGTQLLDAVNACLAVPAVSEKKRIFIFLTDGFVDNDAAVIDAIAKHPSQPTIFTFGAGNNLNRYFLEEAAKVGNGFATPIVEGDATGPLVDAAWGRIESPQLENIQVDFGGLQISDLLYPVSNKLYRGMPYRVLGKYGAGGSFKVTLSADRQGKPVTFTRQVAFAADDAFDWAVPKLWAREKIGQLMLAQGSGETNQAAIIQVSVDNQVLSAYTAFLAVNPVPISDGNSISGGLTNTALKDRPGPGLIKLEVLHGLLYFDWTGKGRVLSISVYDLHGRLLFVYRPGSGAQLTRWIWDGRDAFGRPLTAGRYLIRVQSDAGVRSVPFQWNP